MNTRTRTRFYEITRAILKHRSDHDLTDDNQREVVVDDLVRSLEREFRISDGFITKDGE